MRHVVVPGLLGVGLCAAVILFGAVELNHFAIVAGLVGLLALIWAGKLFLAPVALWKPSPMHWPVLGFVVYTFAHYFLSPYEYLSRLELFQVSLYGLVYFIAANNINRGRERTVLIGILLVLGTIEAMYGIWQAFTQADTVLHVLRPGGFTHRGSGTYICPNHLAGLLEMILGFGLARLALHRLPERESIESQVISKVMIAYAVFALLAGILLTLSRSGWAATVTGLLVFLVWGGLRTRAVWARVAAGTATLCALGVLLFTVPQAKQRLQFTLSGKPEDTSLALRDTSFNGRTWLWSATWKMIQDKPVFGSGAGTWQWVHLKYRHPKLQFTLDYAHNDVLQMISDYGIVGLLLVLWTLGAFFLQARRLTVHRVTSEHRCFTAGAVLAVSILLVHSWFDFNLHIPANGLLFCTILGLVAGMQIPDGPYAARPLKPGFRYALGCGLLLLVAIGFYFIVPAARAAQHTSRGDVQKRYLEWDGAIKDYKKAIALDPKYIRPRTKLGDIYVTMARFRVGEEKQAERMGFVRGAIEQYERAFELNAARGDVLVKLAGAYEMAGELEKARRAFDQALALDPHNANIHSQFARFLRKHGRETEALRAFETLVKLHATRFTDVNLDELREAVRAD
jgi:O-antigen ligase